MSCCYAAQLPCTILRKLVAHQLRQQEDGSYAAKLRTACIAKVRDKIHPRKRSIFTMSHTTTFPVNQNKILSITRTLQPDHIAVEYATYTTSPGCECCTWMPSIGRCEMYNHQVVSWWSNEHLETVQEVLRFPPAVVQAAATKK